MSALPPELEALKDKWVGPVRVPDDLPDHIVEKSGVYIWVRRYREAPESDSALRGLVIYVGADKKVRGRFGLPTRMFDHLARLLGGGQSMYDESGMVIYAPNCREGFRRYRDDFPSLMSAARAEFHRSEYFYVECDSLADVEKATYDHIQSRVAQTWQKDHLWLVVSMGEPKSNRKIGRNVADPIVGSELEGRGLLRWLGLIS